MLTRPIYLFAHIPKTGGQAVRAHFFKVLNRSGQVLAANPGPEDRPSEIASLSEEQRLQCDLVVGHAVKIDLPRLFPDRRPKFFTVLREPVPHVISTYNWGIHRVERYGGDPLPPFEQWFRRGKHSLMSRWLVTSFLGRSTKDCIEYSQSQLLDEASAVLQQFWVVAQLENLERSLHPVFEALGVSNRRISSRNVAGRDYAKHLIRTPEVEERVREHATADMELYKRFCQSSGGPNRLREESKTT